MVKGKFGKTPKNLKILRKWLSEKFCFAFYVFINSSNCWKQSYLDWNLLCLSKKANLKVFKHQISTSMERSEKQLASKANFTTFLQLSSLSFGLRLCERPWSCGDCERGRVWGGLGRVGRRELFASVGSLFSWWGDWALDYKPMKFWDFVNLFLMFKDPKF